jgi:hypothetical protein
MRGAHDLLRRRLASQDLPPVTRHLGDVRILAELASEVASGCGDGKSSTARIKVEQGLFLYRVYRL